MKPDTDIRPDNESSRSWRDVPAAPTLGQRLQHQAAELAVRHVPEFGWLRPFEALRERIAVRGQLSSDRFSRREFTAEESVADRPAPFTSMIFPEVTSQTGRAVEPSVRERLRDAVGTVAAEAVRIHEGKPPEIDAAKPSAEAVTVGRDVFFEPGRYRPHEPVGFGLLVHEATHVRHAMTPDAAWQRATASGVRDEEDDAIRREQEVIEHRQSLRPSTEISRRGDQHAATAASIATTTNAKTEATSPGSVSQTSSASQPMAAMPGRTAPPQAVPEVSKADLDAMREKIYRDLMGRIRSEFERGA